MWFSAWNLSLVASRGWRSRWSFDSSCCEVNADAGGTVGVAGGAGSADEGGAGGGLWGRRSKVDVDPELLGGGG
jgi:hypothetical protein